MVILHLMLLGMEQMKVLAIYTLNIIILHVDQLPPKRYEPVPAPIPEPIPIPAALPIINASLM
jgi:hypothetical protein